MANKINILVNNLTKIGALFIVPIDKSSWNLKYTKLKNNNKVPDRKSNLKEKELLIPINKLVEDRFSSNNYENYGLYILYFKKTNSYYVGTAKKFKKSPEGILKRIRKHRAKATATNCSNSYNHTNERQLGWQFLAKNRYTTFNNDNLSDCFLSTMHLKSENSKNESHYLDCLEFFMNQSENFKKLFKIKNALPFAKVRKINLDAIQFDFNLIN